MKHYLFPAIFSVAVTFLVTVATPSIAQTAKVTKQKSNLSNKRFAIDCPKPNSVLLPQGCNLPQGCPGTPCYEAILQSHDLSTFKFNNWCAAYNPSQPEGQSFLLSELPSEIGDMSVCNYRIVIMGDENHPENNDLNVDKEEIVPTHKSMKARYSLTFFRAMVAMGADRFVFYKAMKPKTVGSADRCHDIVVKAYQGETEIYCGDLAGLYP